MSARWVPASDAIAETRLVTEAEFAERHPGIAVLCQPFDTAGSEGIPPNAGLCWPGDEPRIRFGRGASWATVLVGHPKVSKEHFTLAVVHALANRWGVIDHGSTNGTLVKGRRLEPNTLALVSSGEPVDMADAIRLRFYFAPAALYSVLRAAAPPERVVKCRDELPRLASAMRSLGFDSECDEANGEVKVQSGTDLVVVHASADGFVVEYHKGGLCLRSDLTTIYGSDAEAKLRDLVLANLGFGTEPIDTRTEMETNKKRPPPTAS
jgi:hypothetical protein